MSSPRLTLKQLLDLESIDLTPDHLPDLEAGEVYAHVQAKLAEKAGPVWRIVRSQIPDQLEKLLDIDGVAILVGAWNKARELRKYRDATKYPADDVVVVPLAKHKIESKHQPYLELAVDGQVIGKVHFGIDLALNLEGIELTIQGGRIKKIKTGRTLGAGTFKCEGAILYNVDQKLVSLPGVIDLGEGILIPA